MTGLISEIRTAAARAAGLAATFIILAVLLPVRTDASPALLPGDVSEKAVYDTVYAVPEGFTLTRTDSLIKNAETVTFSKGSGKSRSECTVPRFGDAQLDEAVAERAASLSGSGTEVTGDAFFFRSRLTSVLFEVSHDGATSYGGLVYDRTAKKTITLTDILAPGTGEKCLRDCVTAYIGKNPACFSKSDADVLAAVAESTELGKLDFIVSQFAAVICVNPVSSLPVSGAENGKSGCSGMPCVIPLGEEGVFCGALSSEKEPAIYPWDKVVAITFDDGPHPVYTPQILDILEEYGDRATFFLLGCKLEGADGEIIARMKRLGCEMGNHTWSHSDLRKLTDSSVRSEISRTDELIEKLGGGKTLLLRPPYGELNRHMRGDVGRFLIKWSVDTLDWSHQNAEKLKQNILRDTKSGDIVLMHDIFPSTVEGFRAALGELHEKGFRLVTVSELLALEDRLPDGKFCSRA